MPETKLTSTRPTGIREKVVGVGAGCVCVYEKSPPLITAHFFIFQPPPLSTGEIIAHSTIRLTPRNFIRKSTTSSNHPDPPTQTP